jgi:hypothetical protein
MTDQLTDPPVPKPRILLGMFVIQHGYVGNDLCFWMENSGYGVNPDKVKLFTIDEALKTQADCKGSHDFRIYPAIILSKQFQSASINVENISANVRTDWKSFYTEVK